MRITTLVFVGFVSLIIPPEVQGFVAPLARSPSTQKTPRSTGGQAGAGSVAAARQQRKPGNLSAHSNDRVFRPSPAVGGWGGGCGPARGGQSRPFLWPSSGVGFVSMSAAGEDVGDASAGMEAPQGEGVGDDAAAPPPPPPPPPSPPAARKPAEPIGASGAVEDDILMELVGQDYGMMALLRNDKFRGLIVLLRNLPPEDWVTEVAKAYPDDDEVRSMMGQVGKLMRMIDYYQTKKPRT